MGKHETQQFSRSESDEKCEDQSSGYLQSQREGIDEGDRQIKQIIAKVLHKNQKKYRSDQSWRLSEDSGVEMVNERLERQNGQIARNIGKLERKIRKISSQRRKEQSSFLSLSDRQKLLRSLKQKLKKAEELNKKMESSRRSSSRKKRLTSMRDQILITDSSRIPTLVKPYFSPIMEFQEGLQSQEKKSYSSTGTQVSVGLMEMMSEQNQLDLEISRLQEQVKQGYIKIEKCQSVLLRGVI